MKTRALSTISALAAIAAIAVLTGCSSSSEPGVDSVAEELTEKNDPCLACSINCFTCTQSRGCGWDAKNNKCRSGNFFGPTYPVPGLRESQWQDNDLWCKDLLAKPDTNATCEATNCTECAATTNCGWLWSNGKGRCVPGGRGGPWGIVTRGDNWYFDTSECHFDHTQNKVPPGPRCIGKAIPVGMIGSSGDGGASGSDTSEDYVCDVSVVFPPESGQKSGDFPDYGCAPAASAQATTYDQQCGPRLRDGATSCSVTNCRSTGVRYVCPSK